MQKSEKHWNKTFIGARFLLLFGEKKYLQWNYSSLVILFFCCWWVTYSANEQCQHWALLQTGFLAQTLRNIFGKWVLTRKWSDTRPNNSWFFAKIWCVKLFLNQVGFTVCTCWVTWPRISIYLFSISSYF